MTAHDAVPYDVYAQDVLRQLRDMGGSINEHHFRILLSKARDMEASLKAQIQALKEKP